MPRGAKLALGEISSPEDRVLRITNFHWGATDADVANFFENYSLLDWKRDVNVKSGKSTVAYVLLNTLDEVVRAIEELDLKVFMGREVRVLRAKGGFELTASGLLNLTNAEQASKTGLLPSNYHVSESASALTADDMAFPPLPGNPNATPARRLPYSLLRRLHSDPPVLIGSEGVSSRTVPTLHNHRPQHTDPTGPEHRVLLISNLHPDANRNTVELFFQGYHLIDYKRKYNDRLRRFNNTAFVLFGSVQERDRAKATKDGEKIMGRAICLYIVMRGILVSDNGFLLDEENKSVSTATWSSKYNSAPAIAGRHMSGASCLPIIKGVVGLGIDIGVGQSIENPITRKLKEKAQRSHNRIHAWAHVNTQCLLRREQRVNIDDHISPKARMPRLAQISQCHSGVDDEQPIFFRDPWRGVHLPAGDQVAARRGLGPWNLVGNDSEDTRYNLFTEKQWYAFQKSH